MAVPPLPSLRSQHSKLHAIRNAMIPLSRLCRSIRHFFSLGIATFSVLLPTLLFAAEEDEKAGVDPGTWVMPYFFILLGLGLSIVLLLRPSNRTESSYTPEELAAIKAEEMKKMTGSHV